jgi:quinol monooxygenase YgiN
MRAFVSVVYAIVALAALATVAPSDAQAADESIVVVLKSFPSLGREDEMQARYLKQIEFFRKAEPTSVFHLHRGTKEPVIFLWYEVYESQAALDNHLKIVNPAFQKEVGPPPEGLTTRRSESEIYREIAK